MENEMDDIQLDLAIAIGKISDRTITIVAGNMIAVCISSVEHNILNVIYEADKFGLVLHALTSFPHTYANESEMFRTLMFFKKSG